MFLFGKRKKKAIWAAKQTLFRLAEFHARLVVGQEKADEGPFSADQIYTYTDLKVASQQTVEMLTGEDAGWNALVEALIGSLAKKNFEGEADVQRLHHDFVGEKIY